MAKNARALAAAVALATPLLAADARADVKQQCADDSYEGQTSRDNGKLLDARAKFLSCSRDECPALIRSSCGEWLGDVEKRLPTIVVRAETPAGDTSDVRVLVDGRAAQERLDGRAIPVDPGEHRIRFESATGQVVEEKIVAVQGEKDRLLKVRLAEPRPAAKPEPAPARAGGVPTGAWILGAGSLAAFGAAVLFGVEAKSDLDHLRDTCAPACARSDLDSAKREAVVSDVALAIGVVALAGAVWMVIAEPADTRAARRPGVIVF